MTRQITIAGLRWQHSGPSFYQLAGYPMVEVAYLGAAPVPGQPADPDQWFLFLLDASGEIRVRNFPTRDAACAMVAQAFAL